ncbi:hypothetical protein HMPREF0890_0628 [Lactobacillus gasseri 202-4]|nr:hypothetical protein HMPREF0890_0628 [Lactobacillus gasseri 202-4]
MVLVDIHSHILPGIDDGSPDLDSSLGLAEAAVADGITHALMTPHTLSSIFGMIVLKSQSLRFAFCAGTS